MHQGVAQGGPPLLRVRFSPARLRGVVAIPLRGRGDNLTPDVVQHSFEGRGAHVYG